MSQTYYIDGYNLIHHSPELAQLMRRHFEIARDKLIEEIIRWASASGQHAKLIFDGQGKRTEASQNHPNTQNVEILFSSKNKTADMIIERAVFQSKKRDDIIVVSADRGITDLCMSKGALVMHPNGFWTTLNEASAETSRSIKHTQTTKMGSLEDTLDDKTLSHLEQLRKNLEK